MKATRSNAANSVDFGMVFLMGLAGESGNTGELQVFRAATSPSRESGAHDNYGPDEDAVTAVTDR
ncbi:hypothetical protein BraRD5C2_32730 [Bradyrhizobium sp. RD5-C2]|nr:hypothetical protein BraRD5C2_32730 [Bradyrhizobium sp. RD5-C2]